MHTTFRLVAFSLLSLSLSAAAAENYVYVGAGSQSCGHMLKEVEENPVMRGVYTTWVQGYLTALNVYGAVISESKGLSPLMVNLADTAAIDKWIENWCEDNPLELVMTAAGNLFQVLVKRQGAAIQESLKQEGSEQ